MRARLDWTVTTPVLTPVFYTLPGNEAFAPRPAHPSEDAGADIRAFAPDIKSEDAKDFYRDYEFAGFSAGAGLFINGQPLAARGYGKFVDALPSTGAIFVRPGETVLVETGFKIKLPSLKALGAPWNGLVPQYKIVPRSGLAHKHGIVVTNSPGIVDSGYRDWVRVSLTNRGTSFHVFTHGARIAQGLIEFAFDQSLAVITTSEALLDDTARGEGGFGSTSV